MSSTTGLGFSMHAERTPNPDSIKWVFGERVAPEGVSAHFQEPVGPEVSPLAARLFAVEGVVGVFFASSFITVTKRSELEWTELAEPLVAALKEHVGSGEPAVGPEFQPERSVPAGGLAERIREIIEREVRPAVASDGGDVLFSDFRDGVVEVHLQGSCVGCPSSTATLRMGIEQRLRQEIPEVERVVSV